MTQLLYLYCHSDIFPVLVASKVLSHILVFIASQILEIIHQLIVHTNRFAFSFSNMSNSQTLIAGVPYGYVVIRSYVCNLLSSLLLSAILLTFPYELYDDHF